MALTTPIRALARRAGISARAATASAFPASAVAGEPQRRVQYESHVPTTPVQKVLLSFMSAFTVLGNPERGDMLAALGEVTGALFGYCNSIE